MGKRKNESEMTLDEIKVKMISYEDHVGGSLDISKVKSAKTKKELADIIDSQHYYLSDLANEAQRRLDDFSKSLGLFHLD